jgi:hypothetical protein
MLYGLATDLGTERQRPWERRPIGLAAMTLGG